MKPALRSLNTTLFRHLLDDEALIDAIAKGEEGSIALVDRYQGEPWLVPHHGHWSCRMDASLLMKLGLDADASLPLMMHKTEGFFPADRAADSYLWVEPNLEKMYDERWGVEEIRFWFYRGLPLMMHDREGDMLILENDLGVDRLTLSVIASLFERPLQVTYLRQVDQSKRNANPIGFLLDGRLQALMIPRRPREREESNV